MDVNFPLYPRLMNRRICLPDQRPTPVRNRPLLTHPYANAQDSFNMLEAFRAAIDLLAYRNPEKLSYNPSDALFMQEAKRIRLMGLSAKFKYIGVSTEQKHAFKLHKIYAGYLEKYPDPVEAWGFKPFVEIGEAIKFEIKEPHAGQSYNVLDGFLPVNCGISFIRPSLAKRDALINFIYNFCIKLDIYAFGIQKAIRFLFPLILSLAKHNRFSHPLPAYLIDELILSPKTKLPFNIPTLYPR